MIWTLVVLLVFFWLLGVIGHVGGDLIHFLLVLALAGVIVRFFLGRRL